MMIMMIIIIIIIINHQIVLSKVLDVYVMKVRIRKEFKKNL